MDMVDAFQSWYVSSLNIYIFRVSNENACSARMEQVRSRVGRYPQPRTFVAFKNLLCNASSFFKAALSGEWKEA
jgi:hypothetical protein